MDVYDSFWGYLIPILLIIWRETHFIKTILNVLFFLLHTYTILSTHPLDCCVRIHHFIIITNANWLAPMPFSSHTTHFLQTQWFYGIVYLCIVEHSPKHHNWFYFFIINIV